MRFALLGDHSDGLDMARALTASGRHEIAVYTGPALGADLLRRAGIRCPLVKDLEEVLADPTIDAIIVASPLTNRAAHLRRALQSERHVLCVHPADETPDIAYEAAMLRQDARCVLFPLLPNILHPALVRLAQLANFPGGSVGKVEFIDLDMTSAGMDGSAEPSVPSHVSLPGWILLQALGGEIVEISAFAADEELKPGAILFISGKFESGRLFRGLHRSGPADRKHRLAVVGSFGSMELTFEGSDTANAHLSYLDELGQSRVETWDDWNPWKALVEVFEAQAAHADTPSPTEKPSWQTAIRALELDDALRRSVERRRAILLEYPAVGEEVGFKGTMTLVGCGLLWSIILLAILSVWFPWFGWLIVPLLVFFLGLQVLRWIVPKSDTQ